MKEIPYDAYKNINEIFSEKVIKKIREDYKNNCVGASDIIKNIMNSNDIIAEIICLKNGHAFTDAPIKVFGNEYTHHSFVLMGEWIIDILHTNEIIKTKDYILNLQKDNPKLRIDYTLSTCWYNEEDYPYRPTLQDLIDYKY